MSITPDLPKLYKPGFEGVIKEIGEKLRENRSFLVCGHVRPDGDCIGSQLALYHLLSQMGKTVRLYNSGPIPDHFSFTPGIEKIETTLDKTFQAEVCIFVDCGAQNRVTGENPPCGFLINIDHHGSNGHFGEINYIDPTATAVGEQLYHIIREMGEPISKEIATCIYLSLLSDSGSFRFSNTNSVTFAVAADMVNKGADPSAIAQALFENKTPESIRIKARVLANLHFECGGTFVWSEITWDMYEKAGGELNEPDGLVSDMRAVKGVEISILFHELKEGGMRAGLRSRGKIDVSRIALEMGGGGHPNASGCYIKGDYGELKKKLIDVAIRHMKNQESNDLSSL